MFGIDFVHGGKISKIRQKYCALDHVNKCELLVLQNRFHVAQHSFSLSFYIAGDQIPGGGVYRDLASAKKKIPNAHRLIIRPNRSGCSSRFDDLFRWHSRRQFSDLSDVTCLELRVKKTCPMHSQSDADSVITSR